MISRPGPHRRRPRPDQQHGFTLVEVILAIAILAVMMTLNYRILKGITQAKRLIDDRREGMFIANSVLTRMSKELQLAVKRPLLPPPGTSPGVGSSSSTPPPPPSGSDDPNVPAPGRQPYLSGKNDIEGTSIVFMAKDAAQFIPGGGTSAGVVQITYRTAKDPENNDRDTLSLVREEIPNVKPVAKGYKNALRFPITNNLVSLSFRFYDNQDKQWIPSWDSSHATRLPEIIEYTITLKSALGAMQTYTSAVKVGAVP